MCTHILTNVYPHAKMYLQVKQYNNLNTTKQYFNERLGNDYEKHKHQRNTERAERVQRHDEST